MRPIRGPLSFLEDVHGTGSGSGCLIRGGCVRGTASHAYSGHALQGRRSACLKVFFKWTGKTFRAADGSEFRRIPSRSRLFRPHLGGTRADDERAAAVRVGLGAVERRLANRWFRVDSGATQTIPYADLEVPTGAVNGVNRDFTLSEIPLPAASLRVYRNGLLQKAGTDSTVAVDRVTFLSVATPQIGDVLQATFRKYSGRI